MWSWSEAQFCIHSTVQISDDKYHIKYFEGKNVEEQLHIRLRTKLSRLTCAWLLWCLPKSKVIDLPNIRTSVSVSSIHLLHAFHSSDGVWLRVHVCTSVRSSCTRHMLLFRTTTHIEPHVHERDMHDATRIRSLLPWDPTHAYASHILFHPIIIEIPSRFCRLIILTRVLLHPSLVYWSFIFQTEGYAVVTVSNSLLWWKVTLSVGMYMCPTTQWKINILSSSLWSFCNRIPMIPRSPQLSACRTLHDCCWCRSFIPSHIVFIAFIIQCLWA